MAQHNTEVCETWRARECVYVTLSYSLCSGSHLLLYLKLYKDQLFSTLIYRNREVDVLLCCLFRLRTSQVHCTGSKNAMQLKYHIIKAGLLGDYTLNLLQFSTLSSPMENMAFLTPFSDNSYNKSRRKELICCTPELKHRLL